MRLIYTTIICCLFCISFSASAQTSRLQALKDGVLVVRLTTNAKKVTYFDTVLRNPDLDEKAKTRFQKLKADAIELRNINLVNVINGFKDSYTFSEYRFVLDTDIKQIDEGITKGIFISPDTYELDESISLPAGKEVFYLRAGDYRNGSHPYFITGVVMNQGFTDLPSRVFKTKVKFKERFSTFAKSERDLLPIRARQTPKSLNDKLQSYYFRKNS